MQVIQLWLSVVLVISLLAGLLRIVWGPTAPDRMLAAQLMGTSGVGVMLLFAQLFELPSLRDVALVFALLAAMAAVAFTQHADGDPQGPEL